MKDGEIEEQRKERRGRRENKRKERRMDGGRDKKEERWTSQNRVSLTQGDNRRVTNQCQGLLQMQRGTLWAF